jgi:hypothetical protein
MKLSKIYDPREMNSYQFVAVTGLIMTFIAHMILWFIDKAINNFEALYLCWIVFFALGTIVNYNSKPNDHGHHH